MRVCVRMYDNRCREEGEEESRTAQPILVDPRVDEDSVIVCCAHDLRNLAGDSVGVVMAH